jgi:hypothetical protein
MMFVRTHDRTGSVNPYLTVRPGQRSEALIFSSLYGENSGVYRLLDADLDRCRNIGEGALSNIPTLRPFKSRPCRAQEDAVGYSAMKGRGQRSGFGTPPEDLPRRSDSVCCSNWDSAGEFVEKSGLPVERFEWSMEINEDTGEWWIHGQASPTFTERLIGTWLWLKMKLRLVLRRARSNRW